ncbi:NapC/NirT family cytochrome c [Neobacillus sp. PS2-9]|uniref:cytochrome c3 family protein n=1 Tax=Neobacillus sp. PS2-9 TaxID=3070676 RepID=UPI0027E09E76|nr:NapC/NirT family cytochrome c [Neobacillus sp. PS2-9]WML59063.1 NapC/NirT family cytochrome c [Neobacillus sp. PS2-9]
MVFFKVNQDIELGQEPNWEDSEPTDRKERKVRNPANRWKLLVAALTTFFAMLGLLYGSISYTSTSSFCSTCHEMAPEHVTFQASAHNQIKCIQCHIKPGTKNLVIHKIESLKEVYSHIVGPPDKIVHSVAVSNGSCEQCHSRNRLVTATGDLIVNHKGHAEEGIPCITCHSGVTHAKIVERGINDASTYIYWTKENAKKLMGEKNIKPNMGTCIDCHDQVNQGKKPWKEIAYSLPEVNNRNQEEKVVGVNYIETPEMRAGIWERELPEIKQKTVLEAMGKQQTDVKISMECFTCHQQIKTPENHDIHNWTQRHGEFAVKELDKCLNCHQDSLWIKELEKQDIKSLLTDTKKKITYKQDLVTVAKESRNNYFCSTCHAYSPANHQDRYTWLYDAHRKNSGTPEERRRCFVCHDNEKPDVKGGTAPSDVYCDFCHKGEFIGEPS